MTLTNFVAKITYLLIRDIYVSFKDLTAFTLMRIFASRQT